MENQEKHQDEQNESREGEGHGLNSGIGEWLFCVVIGILLYCGEDMTFGEFCHYASSFDGMFDLMHDPIFLFNVMLAAVTLFAILAKKFR